MSIQILKSNAALLRWRSQQQSPIHFVPTMGALHLGHIQLIKAACNIDRKLDTKVLVSIFVNPLQFSPNEDFNQYPRDLKNDCLVAERAGADAIWAPDYEEIFPKDSNSTWELKAPNSLTAHLCGASRKGHFDGVVSVMTRLLTLLKPNVLILGEKDWQQVVILRELVSKLDISLKLRAVATVRDEEGLAMSSRNQLLSKSERSKALAIPKLLSLAAKNTQNNFLPDLSKLKINLEKNGLEVEYLQAVDPFNLQPVETNKNFCLLAAAVRCGKTRLIDHIFLMNRKPIVAIDGPAGAGKSTVTQAFAKKLGLIYLDTGAMYRAVTWLINEEGIDIEDNKKIERVVRGLKLELKHSDSGHQKVHVNGHNVTNEIRSPEITAMVSSVATKQIVRDALTAQQKKMGASGGLVAEGRDIGTAVFPDAELKVFLTASPSERARRRSKDLKSKGFEVPNLMDLEKQIQERDLLDSNRKVSPLLKAQDATELITDGMNIEEVVEALLELFRCKVPDEVWPTSLN